MFTGHNSKFWDDRYGELGYAYGTIPNLFLTEQQHRFKPGMKTLVVGDGEGRNGVWLATIYVHFAPEVRQQIHRSMLKALKPGGLIVLEAFNLEQLQYQREYDSGGPPIREMLYQPEMLRQDFAGGEIVELTETTTQLHEGQYHEGKASVIRLVLQKNF